MLRAQKEKGIGQKSKRVEEQKAQYRKQKVESNRIPSKKLHRRRLNENREMIEKGAYCFDSAAETVTFANEDRE